MTRSKYPAGYTFRATEEDLKAMAALAVHLRRNGQPWATKSDAIRYAIQTAARVAAGAATDI
jgi:hypothetical protein